MEGDVSNDHHSNESVKLVPFICGAWIGLKRGFHARGWWNLNLNEVPEKEESSLRICCISDTHEREAKLGVPPCDLLLHAGDITRCGSHEAAENFSNWMRSCNQAKEKVFIVGNHDLFYDFAVLERRNLHVPTKAQIENLDTKLVDAASYLKQEGDCVTLKCGLVCGGSPMTCWDRSEDAENWQYGRERNASNGKYKNCKEGYKFLKNTDIALTHIPPFGIGDGAQPIGCVELLKILKESSCLIHVFGHRHSGYGVYYDGERIYVNAAMVKDQQSLNLPIVIDLKFK